MVRTRPIMAIDYNDPVVAEEFMQCQGTPIDEVEKELATMGIVAPVTMNEMDIRLMLVECRLRASGRMPGDESTKKAKKTTFSSEFEKALYQKPAFEELYKKCSEAFDTNRMNVMAEYMTNRDKAIKDYGTNYHEFLQEIEAALNAKVEKIVTSPKVSWYGFPVNIGEQGIRMTFEALGDLIEFESQETNDGLMLEGRATFSDVATAQKCVDQYDGMDMGLGTAIEISEA